MLRRLYDISRHYRQASLGDCGLACLGFVAAALGHEIPLRELCRRFNVTASGVRMADLSNLARDLSFRTRGLFVSAEEAKYLKAPCILHWDGEHFAVLIRIGSRSVSIHDPSSGIRTLSLSDFGRHFSGSALELYVDEGFSPRKRQRPKWRDVIGKIGNLRRGLFQILVLSASIHVFALVGPLLTQWVIDEAIASSNIDLIWVLCSGLVLSVAIRTVLDVTRAWMSLALTTKAMTDWCSRIMEHLMRLPLSWFEERHVGDVTSRFQSTQAIQQGITTKVTELALDVIFCLLLVCVMVAYSAVLTLIAISSVAIYSLARCAPHAAYHRATEEAIIREAGAQSHFIESVRGMQSVKLGRLESVRSSLWTELTMEAVNKRFLAQRMMLLFGGVYALIFGLQGAVVLSVGALQVANGAITLGMLMAFVAYKDDFCVRAQRVVDNILALRGLEIHVDRLAEIALSPVEDLGGFQAREHNHSFVPAGIEIKGVSFRYGSHLPWILEDLDLRIFPEEHVAIVGASGTGKSTLAKLMLGLLHPQRGEIRTDGKPLSVEGLGRWRGRVAAVMQDDKLLSGSLQENICRFDENVDVERMRHAAASADILAEIEAMPMGFSTYVGDMGSTLSGGQKQRVLLARALYSEPDLLVLDEATSHLDVHAERRVNDAIAKLAITRITIAHRPETIAMADRVVSL
ncbi:peptidase domain-containing ABC transporter [Luteibacter yeojuensis]